MFQKIKNTLKEEWAKNAIALLAIICTVASLLLGACQVKETIKHESVLAQKATMLEQTKELPYTMQEFLRSVSLTLA